MGCCWRMVGLTPYGTENQGFWRGSMISGGARPCAPTGNCPHIAHKMGLFVPTYLPYLNFCVNSGKF